MTSSTYVKTRSEPPPPPVIRTLDPPQRKVKIRPRDPPKLTLILPQEEGGGSHPINASTPRCYASAQRPAVASGSPTPQRVHFTLLRCWIQVPGSTVASGVWKQRVLSGSRVEPGSGTTLVAIGLTLGHPERRLIEFNFSDRGSNNGQFQRTALNPGNANATFGKL